MENLSKFLYGVITNYISTFESQEPRLRNYMLHKMNSTLRYLVSDVIIFYKYISWLGYFSKVGMYKITKWLYYFHWQIFPNLLIHSNKHGVIVLPCFWVKNHSTFGVHLGEHMYLFPALPFRFQIHWMKILIYSTVAQLWKKCNLLPKI